MPTPDPKPRGLLRWGLLVALSFLLLELALRHSALVEPDSVHVSYGIAHAIRSGEGLAARDLYERGVSFGYCLLFIHVFPRRGAPLRSLPLYVNGLNALCMAASFVARPVDGPPVGGEWRWPRPPCWRRRLSTSSSAAPAILRARVTRMGPLLLVGDGSVSLAPGAAIAPSPGRRWPLVPSFVLWFPNPAPSRHSHLTYLVLAPGAALWLRARP